ncbi:type IV pilin protein [Oceanospirillum sp.]|uniref:type IV pilin protein n=1 Tax=Oceanospirillum sp. TaxID=2021254 RepID=UPI003A91AD78
MPDFKTVKQGFTLLELLIVLAIVGILAAVAYPSYKNYAFESRRVDAYSSILRIQLAEERWRVSHNSYTSDMTDAGLDTATTSGEGFYTLSVSHPSAVGYRITASAIGSQSEDTGCNKIELTKSASGETRSPVHCW